MNAKTSNNIIDNKYLSIESVKDYGVVAVKIRLATLAMIPIRDKYEYIKELVDRVTSFSNAIPTVDVKSQEALESMKEELGELRYQLKKFDNFMGAIIQDTPSTKEAEEALFGGKESVGINDVEKVNGC